MQIRVVQDGTFLGSILVWGLICACSDDKGASTETQTDTAPLTTDREISTVDHSTEDVSDTVSGTQTVEEKNTDTNQEMWPGTQEGDAQGNMNTGVVTGIPTESYIRSDASTDSGSITDTGQGSEQDDDVLCAPLPAPTGNMVTVQDVARLVEALGNASSGDTILLEDGVYHLDGAYLWMDTPGVTLRSVSGNPSGVVLDGDRVSTEIITVAASDVTVADITIARAYTHPIHVVTAGNENTLNTLIYNVHIIDPREQAIKINPSDSNGYYPDQGTIACNTIELTDEGRPHVNPTSGGCYTGGVDAHAARGWIIRDNIIRGFWCPSGLSEHAIHLWRGCRDTVVERNRLVDNARGIGFGLASSGEARTFEDSNCSSSDYVGHLGGVIRNNSIFVSDGDLLASSDGFDCGICLWSACGARVVHNTIATTGNMFSSIEWRFGGSRDIQITNNLTTHALRERDGASADEQGNIQDASLDLFADGEAGNLHLVSTEILAIDQGIPLETGLCDDDLDGDDRDDFPDIGADEYLF